MAEATKIAKTKLGKLQWRNRHIIFGENKLRIKALNNARKFYGESARQHAHIANIMQIQRRK